MKAKCDQWKEDRALLMSTVVREDSYNTSCLLTPGDLMSIEILNEVSL